MEYRRIFANTRLWVLLALLLVLNLLLFFRTQEKRCENLSIYLGNSSKEVFEEQVRQLELYREYTPEAALKECEELDQEAMENGEWTLEVIVRRNFTLPLVRHVKEYPDYLEQVQANAELMGKFSIFTDNSAFAKKNIRLTAKDFKPLIGVKPVIGDFRGVSALLEYHIADLFVLALLLFIVWSMMEERKKGLWSIVRLSAKGRFPLAVKRSLYFCGASLLFFILLYGSVICAAVYLYGLPDLSVPVQSIPDFATYPIPDSLGIFFAKFIFFKLLGILFLGLFCWLILSSVSNITVAVSLSAAIISIEYVLFRYIPVQSIWNLFKYLNLFSFYSLEDLYYHYLNLNFFGVPVNARRLLLGSLPFFLIGVLTGVILVGGLKGTEGRNWRLLGIYDGIRRRMDHLLSNLHGFGMEVYKLLFVQRGLLILVVVFWLMGQIYPVWGGETGVIKSLEEQKQELWEGSAEDPEVMKKIETELQEIETEYAEYESKKEAYENGEVTEADWLMANVLLQGTMTRKSACETVLAAVEHQRELGLSPWIVNEKWLVKLFGDAKTQRQLALLAMLVLILILAPIFAIDQESGTYLLLRSCKKGGKSLVLRRQLIAFLMVILVFILVYGLHFWSVIRFYGLHGLGAPMQAADSVFGMSDWKLSIGRAVVLIYAMRFALLWILAQFVMAISAMMRRVQSSVLLAFFVLLIPSALWVIGVDVLEEISFAYPLSSYELFAAENFSAIRCFIRYGIYAAVAIGLVIWMNRRMNKTEKTL